MLKYVTPELEVLRFRAVDILGATGEFQGGDEEPGGPGSGGNGSTEPGDPPDDWFNPPT